MKPTAQQNKKRRGGTLVLGTIGLLLAVGAIALFLGTVNQERIVGDIAAVEQSLDSAGATSALPPSSNQRQQASVPTTQPQYSQTVAPNDLSRLDQLSDSSALIPVRLEIYGISVDAPVEPYGVDSRTGQMKVPRNVRDVAWYQYGPSPGDAGSAVLAAHVDLAEQGPGVFYRLRDLNPGDTVVVEYSDASVGTFVVKARTVYDKKDLPLDTIFSRRGSAVLTLITCGGGFNPSVGSYDSNIVVYAVPITPAVDSPILEAA